MNQIKIFLILALGITSSYLFADSPISIAIKGGTILTMAGEPIEQGTVVIRNGKISAVGKNIRIPGDATVVDATGKFIMPGIIDSMTSIGIDGANLNEVSDPLTPDLRAIEGFYPFGQFGDGKPGPIRLSEALSGGVTSMYIAPADRALIGGTGSIVKTAGDNIDALLLQEISAMDITLGEQPKKAAQPQNRDPATRMAEVAMLRQVFIQAQEYEQAKDKNADHPRDLKMEALARMLRREIPARIQANSTVDIRSALRLADEFNFNLIIDGGAAAYSHRDTLAARGIPVVLGQVSHPYVSNEEVPDTSEYPPVDESTPAKLTAAGIKVAIASFSRTFATLAPAGTGKWLLLDASISAGYGMKEQDILAALTINAAEILGVSDRVGSLEKGKDADIIILDGPPLSIKTWVEKVYVNGELVHQRNASE